MKYLTLLVLMVLLCEGDCQETSITLTPKPRNATLGSTVTFTCNGVGDDLSWRINGMSANDPALAVYEVMVTTVPESNTFNSTLTLHASTEESLTIQCVAFSFSSAPAFSQEVTLLIQGLLAPVTDLTSEYYNDYNQILTWTPPFTLDITDLDPDITYRVCNSDTNTCVDTTDTSYIFPTTCFPVEYSVSACNPVGCSENSTIISLPQKVFIQVMIYVQAIELDGRGGNVNVTCTFASEAKGCRVTIVGEGGSLQQMEATRKDESQISAPVIFTGLTNGTFLVAAGNLEADGSFDTGRQPACQFFTVTDAPPPSPLTTEFSPLTTESSAAPSPKPTGSPVLLSPAAEDDGDEAISVGVTVGVVGSMLLVTATVVVAVIVTAVCVVRRSKNTGGIEMRENASYEMVVTRQQQQGVHRMERCPAYEVPRRQN